MKNLYFGAASKISTAGKNLVIVGKDSTRYIIPVSSVDSITADVSRRKVTFNLVADVWNYCGCKSIAFDMGTKKAIDNLLKKFHKLGGVAPIMYDCESEKFSIILPCID